MPNKGTARVILDASKQKTTLPAGYYSSIEISTTLNPTGTTKYTHHIHSTANKTSTIVDQSFSSGAAYGEETSKTSGGCYTKALSGICGTSVTCNSEDWGGITSDGTRNHIWYAHCPNCSNRIEGERGETKTCTRWINSGYEADCGYVSGQVIKAETTF